MEKKNIFSINLIKRRKEIGLTQEQLAQRMDVSTQAVSKWENSGYPDAELLPKLSKVLGISLDQLFGIRTQKKDINIEQLISDEVHFTAPEKRSALIMRMMYTAMCAYDPNYDQARRLKEDFERETFAGIKSDREIAFARLNSDLRYFTFMEIPENGVNPYLGDTKNMVRLLNTLADEDAVRLICYMGSGYRNKMHSVRVMSERLSIPQDKLQRIVDRLDRLGLVWRISADIGDQPEILYGFSHSQPVTMILVLAQSVTNYQQFWDFSLDNYTHGSFRDETGYNSSPTPQVSWWEDEEI